MRAAEIRQRFKRNLWLRLLALAIAVGLWVFVNSAQHETQVVLTVPVQYAGLAPGLMIVSPHPQFVNVSISGPETLLSLLDTGRMAAHLDLHGVTPGEADFKITPDMFHIPRLTSVDSIAPNQITLDIDAITSKQLPVRLDTAGEVASGLKIESVELKPAAVTVTGPARQLSNIGALDTMPLDISGMSADITRTVALTDAGAMVKVPIDRVTATIHLGQVVAQREYRNLPVQVRNTAMHSSVIPRAVSIAVRGPENELQDLNLEEAAYVDAQDLKSGWYEAPIQIDLPKGVQVVRQVPQRIKLRLFRKK